MRWPLVLMQWCAYHYSLWWWWGKRSPVQWRGIPNFLSEEESLMSKHSILLTRKLVLKTLIVTLANTFAKLPWEPGTVLLCTVGSARFVKIQIQTALQNHLQAGFSSGLTPMYSYSDRSSSLSSKTYVTFFAATALMLLLRPGTGADSHKIITLFTWWVAHKIISVFIRWRVPFFAAYFFATTKYYLGGFSCKSTISDELSPVLSPLSYLLDTNALPSPLWSQWRVYVEDIALFVLSLVLTGSRGHEKKQWLYH